MKRRTFIKGLLALPFVGLIALLPKPVEPKFSKDYPIHFDPKNDYLPLPDDTTSVWICDWSEKGLMDLQKQMSWYKQ